MMKKKNGFISISVVYSFFVVFMLLLIIIINSYINNRASFDIYKDYVKNKNAARYVYTEGSTKKLNDEIKGLVGSYGIRPWTERNWYVQKIGNNYYFRGSTPPNFVCLSTNEKDNCQENTSGLYRIVGVFHITNQMTTASDCPGCIGQDLVKLVKYYPYTTSNHSGIYGVLTQYADSTNLFNDKIRSLIAPIKRTNFNSSSSDVKFSYMLTNENNYYQNNVSFAGLLTVSDIGYTTGEFTSPSTINCKPNLLNINNLSGQYAGQHTGCQAYGWNISEQWLYNSDNYENDKYNNGFKINDEGNIVFDSSNTVLNIRPVIYLKPDAVILRGTGTQDNPYMLNIYGGEDTDE